MTKTNEERIKALEWHNIWLRVLLLAIFAFIISFQVQHRRTVGQRLGSGEFQLLDENDKLRARLYVLDEAGPGLEMFDKDGKLRISLFVVDESGPRLEMLDENGEPIWYAP